ncbi:hypothetical protein CVD25_07240 [Bacillus canaveralius]|uniref:DUF4367 domain-containing protein n=1 Tax=Bacillus canaveralius TaxID=1403243 RepID=A0A2N5GH92_9BACI|nr:MULTISPECIES: hypothetical protein [Bacillus]PLR80157.1 hypothetical protein CU635_19295 [Bacillus canaveralius]PLR83825.1 hypothetical protein CVD23_13155 [Bacillus sp. V33-4]PLR98701.1 hypothetical protein CVD25_07240 [Bacillus canaveralius]RSK48203.1 hypothetical protein EJA13_17085 [Bacillus canaveralius]
MRKHYKAALLLVIAVFLLGACSASVKEEQKAAEAAVEKALRSDAKKTNKKNEDIQYHLPFGMEIEDAAANNIVLKNGAKKYLLFYNQHEGSDSQVVYEATARQQKYDVKKTFADDDRFGFLLIKNLEKNKNEVTIGNGGIKITSEVKTRNLKSEAEIMAQIIRSVQFNEKEGSK